MNNQSNESSNSSRRDFLKVAAGAAASLAVLPGCASSTSSTSAAASKWSTGAYVAGSDHIRIGIVGCGGRGTGAVGDCCKASPAVQVVAMGDVFKDRLDTSRKNLAHLGEQLKVTDDHCFVGLDAYKKVLASDIDLVLLTTPPAFRPMHFKAAIEAGKHVFFEKPVAVDATGVRSVIEMSEVAQKKGLGVMAGTCFRHHTVHRESIAQIHEGKIGRIISGNSYYNVGGLWSKPRQPGWTDLEWQLRNWLYFTWLSGDHIVEQNVHRLDIQNWVMQSTPLKAYGMGGRQVRIDPAYGNVFDHFAVEYEYPGGVRIVNECRQIDGTDSRITEYYYGTKGMIEPSAGPLPIDKKNKLEPLGAAYVREHKDLIDSIHAGKPANEGRQVAESTLTAIMGRMSAYTGKVITWEQAMNSKLDLMPTSLEFGPTMAVAPVAVPGKDPII